MKIHATVRVAARLVTLALLAACDRGEPGRVVADGAAVEVRVSPVVTRSSVRTVPARVRSTDEAELSTRASGTVEQVPVNVGMAVRAGETLVVLDASSVNAAIEQTRAEADRAGAYYRRIESLEGDGAATRQELDDARAGDEASRAALDDARAQLAYVVVRAPFDGVVTARFADPGDLAVPGVPLVALVRVGSLEIEADLPGEMLGDVRVGDSLAIRRDETGASLRAHVIRVSPVLDPTSRRTRVELAFAEDPGGMLPPPGAIVRLEVPDPDQSSLWIPADAVVPRGQLSGVYAVVEETLRLRWIRTGARRGDAVEVLAGADAGDLVVRGPAANLADGQRVSNVVAVDWSPGWSPR